jgi:hypothetical protein
MREVENCMVCSLSSLKKIPHGSNTDGTLLGMMVDWDSIFDKSRNFFFQQSDQLWTPPILLFSVYRRLFSQGISAAL